MGGNAQRDRQKEKKDSYIKEHIRTQAEILIGKSVYAKLTPFKVKKLAE
jgi:hypothetical protein